MRNCSRSVVSGLTKIELLVVLATLALLVTLLLPALSWAKGSTPSKISCSFNLRMIQLGAALWATDHNERFPWEVTRDHGGSAEFIQSGELIRIYLSFSNELEHPRILTCSSDRKRQPFATRFESLSAGQLSYFLNATATSSGTNAVMFGDRNVVLNSVAVSPGTVTVRNTDRVTWGRDIHAYRGNLVLVDGSTHQTATDLLPASDWARQPATNLLVFP